MSGPGAGGSRRAQVERTTRETAVRVLLDLDGRGRTAITTGMPFFDHLLDAFGRHGLFDLEVQAQGDLDVDGHHTAEDVGIVLGQALARAVGDRTGIRRFGWCVLPMDEALAMVSLDLSGRAYLAWDVPLAPRGFGAFHTELALEFWRAFAANAGLTLHVKLLSGENSHHVLEIVWKAVGVALSQAVAADPRIAGALSTKGVL